MRDDYWRIAATSAQIFKCEGTGGCLGGNATGSCRAGQSGPLCQICHDDKSYYYHGYCKTCPDVGTRIVMASCALIVILAFVGAKFLQRKIRLRALTRLVDTQEKFASIWERAQMRTKVKSAVGLYQCLGAAPSIFRLVAPEGAGYVAWMRTILELPQSFGITAIVPDGCTGSFHNRLLISTWGPLLLCALVALVYLIQELVQIRLGVTQKKKVTLRAVIREAFGRGALPFALLLTFVLLPSTANRIFKTFQCESFEVDSNGATARFLVEDLSFNCESDEYYELQRDAIIMVCIWPVGVPLFYSFLLWASRRDLREGLKTDITSAGACEL